MGVILERRQEEEADPQLTVSVYDVTRNQKAFQQREEEEERAREEERLQREKERDYLAPFLGRLVGDNKQLDREQMAAVAEVLREREERERGGRQVPLPPGMPEGQTAESGGQGQQDPGPV